jgi:pSer/pThr/pTyr-binding forkhead associated (FHA) protein
MASISFVAADGTESTFLLDPNRALHIGRDPGNDVVLRDPRVSRHHAEIVFERGFFVLRDLGSSNGSYVNGHRIRVAPLTNDSKMKFGNSTGRFSDQGEPPSSATISVDLFKATAVDQEEGDVEAQQGPAGDPVLSEPFPALPEPPEPAPAPPPEPSQTESQTRHSPREEEPVRDPDDPFRLSQYFLDVSAPYGERSVVRDTDLNALLYYRRPVNLAGFIAALVSALGFGGGLAVAALLAFTGDIVPSLLAFLLTIGFSVLILLLVPRQKHVYVYRDEGMSQAALMLWQETRFAFPILRFSLRGPDGNVIALFSRTYASTYGRHRWRIEHPSGGISGCGIENPRSAALLRKILGSFFGLIKTDFRILLGREEVGWIYRRQSGIERHLLDLTLDPFFSLDRRVALGLAVLIDGLERK